MTTVTATTHTDTLQPSEAEIQAAYASLSDLVRSALKYDLRRDKPLATQIAARRIIDRVEGNDIEAGVPLAIASNRKAGE